MGDVETPYSLMPYQYAYAAPTMWTDPSGECIPEDVPGLGETDCVFAGWDPRNWNWADGQAYYDGAPGTMGKLALMALFPPSAYVFGAENFTRGYIRYNEHPSLCGGATVFIDGVLLFLPVASFLRGGGGMATGGGVAVLSQVELLQIQQAVQQATQAGIGIRVLGEYVRYASDPSGKRGNTSSGSSDSLPLFDKAGLRYTHHFKQRLQQRHISEQEALDAYLNGENYMRYHEGTWYAVSHDPKTRVTVAVDNYQRVITTVFERAPKGKDWKPGWAGYVTWYPPK